MASEGRTSARDSSDAGSTPRNGCAGQSPPTQPGTKQTGGREDQGGATANSCDPDCDEDVSPFAELFSGSESSGEEDGAER